MEVSHPFVFFIFFVAFGHDPEKACPGLDAEWKPVFRK
jgi:hypothetical protein